MSALENRESQKGHCPHCEQKVQKFEVIKGVFIYPDEHVHDGEPGAYRDVPPGRGGRSDS